MNTTSTKYPQKILILSDEHRGSKKTQFWDYSDDLLQHMADVQHVVDIGDNAELFYIEPDPITPYSRWLEKVGKHKEEGQPDQRSWKEKLVPAHTRTREKRARIDRWLGYDEHRNLGKHVANAELTFLKQFLTLHPDIHIHKVLGNHEDVQGFRQKLSRLQSEYPNFEWGETIRIGNGLFTHSHLQLGGYENGTPIRYKFARSSPKATQFMYLGAGLDDAYEKWRRWPSRAARQLHEGLKRWQAKGETMTQNGQKTDFCMDGVTDVFSGHTHNSYQDIEVEGVGYHNTGSFVKPSLFIKENIRVLTANLHADGSITDIQRVHLRRNRNVVAVSHHIVTPGHSL